MSLPPIGPNKPNLNPFEGVRASAEESSPVFKGVRASAKESSPLPQPQDNPIVRFVRSIFEKLGSLFSSNKDNVANKSVANLKVENLNENKSSLLTKIKEFFRKTFFNDPQPKNADVNWTESPVYAASEAFSEASSNDNSSNNWLLPFKFGESMYDKDQLENNEVLHLILELFEGKDIDLKPVSIVNPKNKNESIGVPRQFKIDAERCTELITLGKVSDGGSEETMLNERVFIPTDFKDENVEAFENFTFLKKLLGENGFRLAASVLNQAPLYLTVSDFVQKKTVPTQQNIQFMIEISDSEIKLTTNMSFKISSLLSPEEGGNVYWALNRQVTIPKDDIPEDGMTFNSNDLYLSNLKVVENYSKFRQYPEEAEHDVRMKIRSR